MWRAVFSLSESQVDGDCGQSTCNGLGVAPMTYPHSSHGSIPAHAGEPETHSRHRRRRRVYPRACGGTVLLLPDGRRVEGLSPRMRGNQHQRHHWPLPRGSIPAHAGEPQTCVPNTGQLWVYPRACGGTETWPCSSLPLRGLSPRMRGNPQSASAGALAPGSIPAHAGEPPWALARIRLEGVYPRACGGTRAAAD